MSLVLALALAGPGVLEGPARFCGYAPIIDLIKGERIVTRDGGIHSGSFRWKGAFGGLDVTGIGWGGPPDGRQISGRTSKGHILFHTWRDRGRYIVALWNGRHGVAYFTTSRPPTRQQLAAIDRVDLFEEGEEPQGCTLRTLGIWG